jgi:hypothetical protein
MSSLTELLLDCNEITSLPLSVGRLTELQVTTFPAQCLALFQVPNNSRTTVNHRVSSNFLQRNN